MDQKKIQTVCLRILIITLALWVLPISSGFAQDKTTIPWSNNIKLYSEAVNDTFLISIALPENYDKKKEYPVVYLTDPRFAFGTAVEASRALAIEDAIPPVILIGIGYAGNQEFGRIMQLRSRDYSEIKEPQVPGGWPAWADDIDWGGADAFLEFIKGDLIPYVEQNFTTTGERTFMGWSGGGHFGLYTLFKQPDLFKNYLLVSAPFEWFHNGIAFQYEEEYANNKDSLNAHILFVVGTEESKTTFEANKRMANILQNRGHTGLDVSLKIVEDKNHYAVWPIAINHGLQQLLKKEE